MAWCSPKEARPHTTEMKTNALQMAENLRVHGMAITRPATVTLSAPCGQREVTHTYGGTMTTSTSSDVSVLTVRAGARSGVVITTTPSLPEATTWLRPSRSTSWR